MQPVALWTFKFLQKFLYFQDDDALGSAVEIRKKNYCNYIYCKECRLWFLQFYFFLMFSKRAGKQFFERVFLCNSFFRISPVWISNKSSFAKNGRQIFVSIFSAISFYLLQLTRPTELGLLGLHALSIRKNVAVAQCLKSSSLFLTCLIYQ